jgi:hypothetical protein
LLGERVALKVLAGRGLPYVEPAGDKDLGKPLLIESLLIELLRERVA